MGVSDKDGSVSADKVTAEEKTLLKRWKSSKNNGTEQHKLVEPATTQDDERRLAAIMFTDMTGYTALSQKNEVIALNLLEEHRLLLRPIFRKHNGREIKTMGDAFLVEFASALEAVQCTIDIQGSVNDFNMDHPSEKKLLLKIGVHLGDVIHRNNDVLGDAVNVASRIGPLCVPGSVCVTEQVYSQVRNKLNMRFSSLGKKKLKNVKIPIEVYRLNLKHSKLV